mmetsp:Transcript_12581/g.28895  ORF Transcript_12581/g.28895 Transcript_12581/m.28895 type:complete len:200 (-) Transcript_12581:624-1223(-)
MVLFALIKTCNTFFVCSLHVFFGFFDAQEIHLLRRRFRSLSNNTCLLVLPLDSLADFVQFLLCILQGGCQVFWNHLDHITYILVDVCVEMCCLCLLPSGRLTGEYIGLAAFEMKGLFERGNVLVSKTPRSFCFEVHKNSGVSFDSNRPIDPDGAIERGARPERNVPGEPIKCNCVERCNAGLVDGRNVIAADRKVQILQ